MTVTDVEAIPVEIAVKPLDEAFGLAPYVSNHANVESVTRVLIRVDTDEGVTGWGEMLVGMQSAVVTKAVIDDVVAPELVGQDVGRINEVVDEFYFPYVGVRPFLGAVETALWDALGKRLSAPIHQLLGGKTRERVPIAFCLGILDPEASATHARSAADAGFETLKTKAGHDWRQDIARIRAIDDAVDGELELRLDPNQGWQVEDAVRVATRLEEAGVLLQYLEQPIRTDTYGTYATLRNKVRTPIAVNEDTYMPRNLRHLLRTNAIDVAVIDLVPAGGIAAARDQAVMAANAGISVTHHCGFDLGVKTAAMLHTVASTPAINLPPDSVYYAWTDDILVDPFAVENGSIPIPNGPGLGVEVDEAKVERYRVD